ncbi:MAG: heme ABC transporter ATP-binding protein, partial [Bradyrhizobium sp.]|nr:heme ABC transporter ATP-binding protein [Bradyrhizobium sp.]
VQQQQAGSVRGLAAGELDQLGCGEAVHGPGLLLLDEPTSSLDLRHQIDLVETARRRAADGTAVVAILHDLNLAVRFADRIVVMHRGAKVADDVPERTVTDDLLRTVFEIEVRVQRHSDGTPLLLPQLMKAIASRER